MKNILKLLLPLLGLYISSCGCPECFNISEPVRIIYLNENGDNLLANRTVNPQSTVFCNSSLDISFGIKDYIVNGSPESYHLEFANELLQEKCESKECCIIIEFKDAKPDTLIYQIKRTNTKCCTSFPVSKFKYNGINLLGKTENLIGAYVITKR
jgi:hypothetical protein